MACLDNYILYTSLAFSSLARKLLEKGSLLALAEILVQVVLLRLTELGLLTYVATFFAFLFLAFCQTKAEYWDISQNLREIEASREAASSLTAHGLRGRRLLKQVSPAEITDGTHSTPRAPQALHGKPVMYPSVLRHIRTAGGFKDDFSHSYLYVGVPVGIHETYAPVISMDQPSHKALWSIRPQDQAIRGGKALTLTQKLEECLLAQGQDPSEWSYAYLLTSPCMNDHNNNNNPLAFWYLYNSEKELTALVLQLDTSYGERRLWFVRNSMGKQKKDSPYCFHGSFVKDLQVSPFMPLGSDTSYTVDSSDPCASPDGPVNILITLKKGDKTLMVASVKPHSPMLNISTASTWSRLAFLWRWWWVPMATVVTCRILGSAARIYLTQKKNIQVQLREEPIKTVTAKPARTVEMTLERYFCKLLRSAVECQSGVAQVKYITPGEHSPRVRIFRSKQMSMKFSSQSAKMPGGLSEDCSEITFQVISPAFFIRFFHYSSALAALKSELLDDERTRMVWCSDPGRFASIVSAHSRHISPVSADWRWKFVISNLRCPPLATNYEHKTAFESFRGLSTSDSWISQNCTPAEQSEYRRTLLRVYLGETIGSFPFGSLTDNLELFGLSRDAVLRIQEACLKTLIALWSVEFLRHVSTDSRVDLALAGFAVSGLNIWACLKSVF